VTTVDVAEEPECICTSGEKVFVLNERTLSIIDLTDDNYEVVNIPIIGSSPTDGICSLGDKVFVPVWPDSVFVFDVAGGDYEVVPVGNRPSAICSSGDKVFVANEESNSVSIINVTEGNYEVVNVPVGIVLSHIRTSGNKIVAMSRSNRMLSIITPVHNNYEVVDIMFEVTPCAICTSEDKIFVASRMNRSLFIIAPTEGGYEVNNVPIGISPSSEILHFGG
jgi:YVTN family beta-propeller protein